MEKTDAYPTRKDYKAAGIPEDVWNRDTRAGGVTEADMAGTKPDDRRKIAGHAKEATTEIYERDVLEAHRRVMQARRGNREKSGTDI
jgi:hypothetical protein